MDTYNQNSNIPIQNDMQMLDFHHVLFKMAGDMKFLAIYSIVYGAINCLTIIGAAIGVPMIFVGIRMKDSAEAFRAYTSVKDVNILQQALFLQSKYMRTLKILGIISIILFIVVIAIYITFFGVLLSKLASTNTFTGL